MSEQSAVIQRLKSSIPIRSVISEEIELTERSSNAVGLCPFHDEKSPSFYVFEDNYYCFGCKASGDIIQFVRKNKGFGFVDAVKYLAEKFSVEIPEFSYSKKDNDQREKLTKAFQIFDLAYKTYIKNLWNDSSDAKKVQDYLINRGFTTEQIKQFGFGLSSSNFDELTKLINQNGYLIDDAENVHLVRKSKKYKNQHYDFFRNRIMIPIRDRFGRLVAFGGRSLGDELPKYVNSQNHMLYDKKSVLFGFSVARDAIKKAGKAIVVEGYMDAMVLWANGFLNTVAVLGTNLSKNHMRQLQECSSHLVLLFDGDQAGHQGALKVLDDALDLGNLNITVGSLPNGSDPDSFVKDQGKEALTKVIDDSNGLFDVVLKDVFAGAAPLMIPKMFEKKLLPWLRQVKDPIKQNYLINKISNYTQISSSTIEDSIRSNKLSSPQATNKSIESNSDHNIINEGLDNFKLELEGLNFEFVAHLAFASSNELDLVLVKNFLDKEFQMNEVWRLIANHLIELLENGKSVYDDLEQVDSILLKVLSEKSIEVLRKIKEHETAFSGDGRQNKIIRIIRLQQESRVKLQIASYRKNIAFLKNNEDSSRIVELLTSIDGLNKKLKKIQTAISELK